MEYSKLAYYAALFANDLKHIHIHAAGESMDDIRTESDTLFYKAMRDHEDFSKLAIMNNEKVGNVNSIRSYVPDTEWKSIDKDAVDFNDFVMYVAINGQQYLNAIKNIEDKDRETEDRIKYWEEAVTYDNGQRMAYTKSVEDSNTPTPRNPYPPKLEVTKAIQNMGPQEMAVIAVPSWRDAGASSALSKAVLGV